MSSEVSGEFSGDEIARIDALATERGLTREAMIAELVHTGILSEEGRRWHERFPDLVCAPPDAPGAPPLLRLDDVTRRHILDVFRATHENLTLTARVLGISRVALRRRLRVYGVRARARCPTSTT